MLACRWDINPAGELYGQHGGKCDGGGGLVGGFVTADRVFGCRGEGRGWVGAGIGGWSWVGCGDSWFGVGMGVLSLRWVWRFFRGWC